MYYLNSRYYSPDWGRFLNADGIVGANGDILSYNLYAYCSNNPINYADPSGESLIILGIATIAALVAVTAYAVDKMVEHHNTEGHISFSYWLLYVSEGVQIGSSIQGLGYLGQGIYDTAKFYSTPKTASTTNQNINQSYTSKGSAGRTTPSNIKEQMAMNYVMQNPQQGKVLTNVIMNDSRWPSYEGWVKMSQSPIIGDKSIQIHYVANPIFGHYDDFKFK